MSGMPTSTMGVGVVAETTWPATWQIRFEDLQIQFMVYGYTDQVRQSLWTTRESPTPSPHSYHMCVSECFAPPSFCLLAMRVRVRSRMACWGGKCSCTALRVSQAGPNQVHGLLLLA